MRRTTRRSTVRPPAATTACEPVTEREPNVSDRGKRSEYYAENRNEIPRKASSSGKFSAERVRPVGGAKSGPRRKCTRSERLNASVRALSGAGTVMVDAAVRTGKPLKSTPGDGFVLSFQIARVVRRITSAKFSTTSTRKRPKCLMMGVKNRRLARRPKMGNFTFWTPLRRFYGNLLSINL